MTGSSDTPFVRDFNPFASPVDFTLAGIYEPLLVFGHPRNGRLYKWLASGLAWSKDGKTVTLTVRNGVRWSDGTPLTNRDVLYTLTAGRQNHAMDQIGLTRRGNDVASIHLVGTRRVAIHLKRRDSTFVTSVLANNLFVVPEHVFAKVKKLAAWMNPNPVGSGPFTVVKRFSNQAYTLARNPHYWLKGAPHFSCIERVLGSSGESAIAQMLTGAVDFSNLYVPNVEKTYVSHDPQHFHYFYPTVDQAIGLYLDDTKYPYSLAAFRKAISRALDRETISRFAEFGYTRAVDAIGIDQIWNGWVDPRWKAEAGKLASYNPVAARRMLLAAGFTYRQNVLLDPRGHRVSIKAKVIAGWTDHRTVWQVITRELKDIGIRVDVEAVPNWGAWQPDAYSTKVATLLWSEAPNGATPEPYFAANLDRANFVPSGKSAELTGDWEHFQSAEGTRLVEAFRKTFDRRAQLRLASKLERLWLDVFPYVPLFAEADWSIYSTRHFVGFPSNDDFYLRPWIFLSDFAVALTRIRPAR